MRKIKIFGKTVPIAIVMLLLVGVASAGLLTYYGKITATINVEQSVKLDGKSIPQSEITEVIDGVAGSQMDGTVHYLTNANPDKDAIVSLDSECISGPNGCDGLTITPKFRLDAVVGDDNDDLFVIPPTGTWSDFESVSFDYFITEDSVYTKTPHVNIALRDGEGNAVCLLVSNEIATSKGEWKTATFDKSAMESGSKIPLVDGGCDNLEDLTYNSVTIEVADGWNVIQEGQQQTVWVKNVKVNGVDNLWFRVPNANYGNEPARTVHFVMEYDFDIASQGGTYTVNTVVTPQGIYTQGGTWAPE